MGEKSSQARGKNQWREEGGGIESKRIEQYTTLHNDHDYSHWI